MENTTKRRLNEKFDAINSVGENSVLFKHIINKERDVVDVDMVLPFFQVCQDDTSSSQIM